MPVQVVPRAAYSTSHFTTEYTLSTEDRLEIIDLCHKFDRALNLGQQDKLGAFFVPEAQVGGSGCMCGWASRWRDVGQ